MLITTDEGNTASEANFNLAISPGKAYVKGYEIEKPVITFKDIAKARDFETVNAGTVNNELGNFVKVTNLYNQPNITSISGETVPYKELQLHDDVIATRGTAAGKQIGVARARSIEYRSGTAGNTDAIYNLYLFDIRPFTYLTLNDIPSPTLTSKQSDGGVQVKGESSGATVMCLEV